MKAHIPVILGEDFSKLVGRATVGEDNNVDIRVIGDIIQEGIVDLVSMDLIHGISISILYTAAKETK